VRNEFICVQWERKGMLTVIYFCVQCHMVPEANFLHSPVRFLPGSFEGVVSCPSSTQQLSPFHVRAVTCDRPGNAGA